MITGPRRGAGTARISVPDATRVVPLVQNTPGTDYDPDWFERTLAPLALELELLQ